ncbi:hypothetical protein KM043_008382 [Ampulex compressa]|nr:hypothetical protein KM043_008382 [Ampulex compressa]
MVIGAKILLEGLEEDKLAEGPGGRVGTSWSYMMYMVRGNRGGAETDGRAEDPFEAAACGASASALEVLLLPLAPFENRGRGSPFLPLRNRCSRKPGRARFGPGATHGGGGEFLEAVLHDATPLKKGLLAFCSTLCTESESDLRTLTSPSRETTQTITPVQNHTTPTFFSIVGYQRSSRKYRLPPRLLPASRLTALAKHVETYARIKRPSMVRENEGEDERRHGTGEGYLGPGLCVALPRSEEPGYGARNFPRGSRVPDFRMRPHVNPRASSICVEKKEGAEEKKKERRASRRG